MIAFTSDIDWAPEEVIKDFLSFFEKYNIKCTLFCTHYSKELKNCNTKLFELGIHPNFNELLVGNKNLSAERIVDELIELYPNALGVRSHSMTQSTLLLDIFKNKGMMYDSNQFLPFIKNIKPYMGWNGLLRIPYNWEDDIVWMYGKKLSSDWINYIDLKLDYWVFDFHPIHVFLNTDRKETYLNAKKHYQNPSELIKRRNNSSYGTRNFLEDILKKTSENSTKPIQLRELC